MRFKKTAVILIVPLLLLSACVLQRISESTEIATTETPRPEQPLVIAVASDLHCLSQKLTDNGTLFSTGGCGRRR